jgi:hypothetical protein
MVRSNHQWWLDQTITDGYSILPPQKPIHGHPLFVYKVHHLFIKFQLPTGNCQKIVPFDMGQLILVWPGDCWCKLKVPHPPTKLQFPRLPWSSVGTFHPGWHFSCDTDQKSVTRFSMLTFRSDMVFICEALHGHYTTAWCMHINAYSTTAAQWLVWDPRHLNTKWQCHLANTMSDHVWCMHMTVHGLCKTDYYLVTGFGSKAFTHQMWALPGE